MFSLPTQVFNYLICNYVDFYDFMQFSVTCKKANTYYRKFMANKNYAFSCPPTKAAIYQYVASALIVKKIRFYKQFLRMKHLKSKTIKKINKKIKNCKKSLNFPPQLMFNRNNCVDLVLIGVRDSMLDRIKFTKAESEILIKYNRHFQIVKYAGIHNIPFTAKTTIEETAYAFGQMKSNIKPKYINSKIFNRAILKNKFNVIKKNLKHHDISSYTIALLGGNHQIINLLAKNKIKNRSATLIVTDYIGSKLIKAKNFDLALNIIMNTDLLTESSKCLEEFIDYLANKSYRTLHENDILSEMVYYYATNALAKKNINQLERARLSFPLMLFLATYYTPPKMLF